MTHQVPPAPPGVPAEMTLTLPANDVATIHGVLASDARAIMRGFPTREQRDYAEYLAQIARAIDHQARQQLETS